LVSAPAIVDSQQDTGLTFTAPVAGTYLMRLTWSPYFVASGAQVRRAPGNRVEVTVRTPGTYRLHAVWRLP
jgi:hypothetical protein